MPRRRPRDDTEPLFGEDWWREDQQLFQDSLARQTTTRKPGRPPAPRRSRAARKARPPATLPGGYAQDTLFTADDLTPAAQQGAEDEPLRPDGPEALGTLAARHGRWRLGVKPSKLRPRRTGICTPSSASSLLIASDSAGCDTWHAAAARPKCRSFARALRYSRRRSSIVGS